MKKLLLITFCFCTILVVQSQEKELKKEKEIEFGIAGGWMCLHLQRYQVSLLEILLKTV